MCSGWGLVIAHDYASDIEKPKSNILFGPSVGLHIVNRLFGSDLDLCSKARKRMCCCKDDEHQTVGIDS